ncbi:MAG: extracellular elastinolytic metalloproteinase [Nocardioidaceae bacterium]|nr:extracellular elastinolytic metalloproteinase [Nocardioidaceae bacterium]
MIVSPAVAASSHHGHAATSPVKTTKAHESKGFYDARQGTRAQQAKAATKTLQKGTAADLKSLRKSVGTDAQISFDPATGTPSNVASEDGYLTGKSSASAADIALGYVRSHAADLGLSSSDLSTFKLRSSYTDPLGTRHLSWQQTARGIPVFGNGLRAHVDKSGRLIAIQGSPIAGLADKTGSAPDSPSLSASSARSGATKDVGGSSPSATQSGGSGAAKPTKWANGDKASLVWFVSGSGVKLGWNTYTQSKAGGTYSHVVDASSGKVLYRNNLVDSDKGDAYVYDNYPKAAHGGTPKAVNFFSKGWLSKSATWLKGADAYVYSDVNDNNIADESEKAPVPSLTSTKLHAFSSAADDFCTSFVCTWNPNTPNSWKTNQVPDAANAFYLASTFHDYLKKAPFGFTGSAGNFESGGGDPVLLQTLDGANTDSGLPDPDHIDNANMATPPDGTPPTMQMYLWHFPGTTDDQDPYVPGSGAFDASILLHEYTHGLSNRLVVDASGNSTLNSIQAGSMGEAWSDYSAEDYLKTQGFVTDSNTKDGEILEGKYITGGSGIRTEAMDCTVGQVSSHCPAGGYTYGDFPTIGGSPEVHASGEVWAQTLWDIRKKYGHTKADTLITRGMELSPADPTMLDMRNAILQADKVAYAGADASGLWDVFAKRGMGYFAGAADGGDTQPAQDFHHPPSAELPRGTMSGTVSDANTGDPLVGALVRITGHDSGYIGSFTAVTNGSGQYGIANLPQGTYQKVVVSNDGYEIGTSAVTVNGDRTKNFKIRKDYAASSGGADITAANGPDYTAYGCGPGGAIDLSQGTGWGSTTGNDAGDPASTIVPKAITVKLPSKINISDSATNTAFAVDPTATCGDPGSSSTGDYKIEVSPDGSTWTTAVDGTGAHAFTAANRYHFANVPSAVNAIGVQYVRFTMLAPQVPDFSTNCPDGPYGGCQFMDMTELEVFGSPTP